MERTIFYVTAAGDLVFTPRIGDTIQAFGWAKVFEGELSVVTYLRHGSKDGPDIIAHMDNNALDKLARVYTYNGFPKGDEFADAPVARKVKIEERQKSAKPFQRLNLEGYKRTE